MRRLALTPGPVTVYTSSLHAPSTLKRSADLATRFAERAAAEIGGNARAIPGLSGSGHGSERVLALRVEIAERITLTAELSQGRRRFWDRFKPGAPGALATAQESRPLDAEIRSYLPPVPLIVQRIDKILGSDEGSVALACGDLDADGSIELVSVGRSRIRVGRFVRGQFSVERQAAWSQLTGVAARPLRDPIGVAQIAGPAGAQTPPRSSDEGVSQPTLLVGLSDRAEALRLDAQLSVVKRYPNRLPWPPAACVERAGFGLFATPLACASKAQAEREAFEPEALLDAVAGAHLVRADGSSVDVLARRRVSGSVGLRVASNELEPNLKIGASVAVADVNADGQPELLSSEDTLDPSGDALSIRTLTASSVLEPVLRLPVPTGIHAIAVCPAEPLAMAPIVLATGEGFWVLR